MENEECELPLLELEEEDVELEQTISVNPANVQFLFGADTADQRQITRGIMQNLVLSMSEKNNQELVKPLPVKKPNLIPVVSATRNPTPPAQGGHDPYYSRYRSSSRSDSVEFILEPSSVSRMRNSPFRMESDVPGQPTGSWLKSHSTGGVDAIVLDEDDDDDCVFSAPVVRFSSNVYELDIKLSETDKCDLDRKHASMKENDYMGLYNYLLMSKNPKVLSIKQVGSDQSVHLLGYANKRTKTFRPISSSAQEECKKKKNPKNQRKKRTHINHSMVRLLLMQHKRILANPPPHVKMLSNSEFQPKVLQDAVVPYITRTNNKQFSHPTLKLLNKIKTNTTYGRVKYARSLRHLINSGCVFLSPANGFYVHVEGEQRVCCSHFYDQLLGLSMEPHMNRSTGYCLHCGYMLDDGVLTNDGSLIPNMSFMDTGANPEISTLSKQLELVFQAVASHINNEKRISLFSLDQASTFRKFKDYAMREGFSCPIDIDQIDVEKSFFHEMAQLNGVGILSGFRKGRLQLSLFFKSIILPYLNNSLFLNVTLEGVMKKLHAMKLEDEENTIKTLLDHIVMYKLSKLAGMAVSFIEQNIKRNTGTNPGLIHRNLNLQRILELFRQKAQRCPKADLSLMKRIALKDFIGRVYKIRENVLKAFMNGTCLATTFTEQFRKTSSIISTETRSLSCAAAPHVLDLSAYESEFVTVYDDLQEKVQDALKWRYPYRPNSSIYEAICLDSCSDQGVVSNGEWCLYSELAGHNLVLLENRQHVDSPTEVAFHKRLHDGREYQYRSSYLYANELPACLSSYPKFERNEKKSHVRQTPPDVYNMVPDDLRCLLGKYGYVLQPAHFKFMSKSIRENKDYLKNIPALTWEFEAEINSMLAVKEDLGIPDTEDCYIKSETIGAYKIKIGQQKECYTTFTKVFRNMHTPSSDQNSEELFDNIGYGTGSMENTTLSASKYKNMDYAFTVPDDLNLKRFKSPYEWVFRLSIRQLKDYYPNADDDDLESFYVWASGFLYNAFVAGLLHHMTKMKLDSIVEQKNDLKSMIEQVNMEHENVKAFVQLIEDILTKMSENQIFPNSSFLQNYKNKHELVANKHSFVFATEEDEEDVVDLEMPNDGNLETL